MRSRSPQDASVRLGRAMLLLGWVAGLGVLVLAFGGWLEREHRPEPMQITRADGGVELVVRRNRGGHYVTGGRINGVPVALLIDTGASEIALPLGLAERLELALRPGGLTQTANGTVRTWSTRLEHLELGGILARDLPAVVLPEMPGDEVLLGMRFLRHLELTQRAGTLTLRLPAHPH